MPSCCSNISLSITGQSSNALLLFQHFIIHHWTVQQCSPVVPTFHYPSLDSPAMPSSCSNISLSITGQSNNALLLFQHFIIHHWTVQQCPPVVPTFHYLSLDSPAMLSCCSNISLSITGQSSNALLLFQHFIIHHWTVQQCHPVVPTFHYPSLDSPAMLSCCSNISLSITGHFSNALLLFQHFIIHHWTVQQCSPVVPTFNSEAQ
jgi:hypothetical protein